MKIRSPGSVPHFRRRRWLMPRFTDALATASTFIDWDSHFNSNNLRSRCGVRFGLLLETSTLR